MSIDWEAYKQIRHLYMVEKQSIRGIARSLHMTRRTIRKYCRGGVLPDTRRPPREQVSPLREHVTPEIMRLLKENSDLPAKQRLSARDIWQHLMREQGIVISESTVRRLVRELKDEHPEVYLPLAYDPGDTLQLDWGDMSAVIAGVKTVVSVFCAVLPYSGALFACVYPDKSTISFLDGHIRVFEHINGTARRCVYDNLRTAVAKYTGKHAVKQPAFVKLEAHYGFQGIFCNARSAWEKSHVEIAVATIRRKAFTPMPHVDTWADLQTHVSNQCLAYMESHRIQGRSRSIREMFSEEQALLLPLPAVPLDTGFTTVALVHSDQTVQYEGTRYSVPPALTGKNVTLRTSPFHLSVFYEGREVYRHVRALDKYDHQYVLDHYLEVLERKPRAVNQAIPLKRGVMPKECQDFLRLCRETDARQQLVDILLLGRQTAKDNLLWALAQANNTQRPSLSLVRFFLEAQQPCPVKEDVRVEHRDMAIYDALIPQEGGNRNDRNQDPE